MPIPQIPAPVIAAGVSLVGDWLNNSFSSSNNQAQRQHELDMYRLQRADALSDWARNNAYNHPGMQMKRLREAGINPVQAWKGGAYEAPPVRSSTPSITRSEPMRFNPANALAAYYNTQMQTTQLDNLREQNKVLQQDAALKAAQTIATIVGSHLTSANIDKTRQEVDQKGSLFSSSLQAQQLLVEKMMKDLDLQDLDIEKKTADIQFTLDSNERAWIDQRLRSSKQAVDIRHITEQIIRSRMEREKIPYDIERIKAATEEALRDLKLKDYEIKLNKQNIQKGDNMIYRNIQRVATYVAKKITTPKISPKLAGSGRR